MKNYIRGLRAGIPIALGYLSVSFTFGIIAVKNGFTWWEALIISMTCVTSAGQFSGINTMMIPGQYFDMIISQLTINVRYSFMSISLSQKVNERFRGIWRWLFGFMITDEIFAVASSQAEPLRPSYMYGLILTPFIGWSTGTLLGAIAGDIMPPMVTAALSLMLYGMFIAIILPPARKDRKVLFVVLIAAALSIVIRFCLPMISGGFSVIICALVASVVGALFFPVSDQQRGEGGA